MPRWPRSGRALLGTPARRLALVMLLGVTGVLPAEAQGPGVAYYYDPGVELPWAALEVSMGGGSRLRVPFLPVVAVATRAPLGTDGYRRDVSLDVPMVFVGDGLVTDSWDAYRFSWSGMGEPLDVGGKAVVLCSDCRTARAAATEEEALVSRRIATAASRGAAAVILFPVEEELPFLDLEAEPAAVPEVPAITLSRSGAAALLAAAGAGGEGLLEQLTATGEGGSGPEPPPSRELITRATLRIAGGFETLETPHFVFRFRSAALSREALDGTARVHESSLASIERVLGPGDHPWPVSSITYFAGFDSKVFFTHHWGSGLANQLGVFLVWTGEPAPGLIAHEHTHAYTGLNWGRSSSFLNEGVARYVAARVTDPGKDDVETLRNLQQGALPPLEVMLPIDVGSDERTPVAYPAAGSLVGYLAEQHGIGTVREIYRLEGRTAEEKAADGTWEAVLGIGVDEVDRRWRDWLRAGRRPPASDGNHSAHGRR